MEKEQLVKKLKEKNPLAKGIRGNALGKNIKEARAAVRKKMFSYIAAGFGLVIGLAWNNAISSLIKKLFPNDTSGIFAQFVYAAILTVIVGYVLFYIEKILDGNGDA